MMKSFFILFFAALFFCVSPSFSAPDKTLILARESIVNPAVTPQAALIKYAAAAKKTIAAPVIAEYAYALAYAGLPEAALYNIDRALITEPLNAEVRFYLSELLNAFGLEDAFGEVSAPAPAWLKKPLKLPALDVPAPAGNVDAASSTINLLMAQKRYAQSAVLFDRLCKTLPGNARCRAGYAIALEKLGCYKAAAAQVKKDIALVQNAEHEQTAAAFLADLEKRQALKYSAPVEKPLKGRYLAFLGGSFNRTDGETTYAFNTRAGKFISDRLDISANAAINGGNPISEFNGLTLGAGARYNKPLQFAPLNGTLAARLERVPAPEAELALLVSPGVSYFTASGSLDLFMDFALSGAFKGSRTLSVGYTVYFGGGR